MYVYDKLEIPPAYQITTADLINTPCRRAITSTYSLIRQVFYDRCKILKTLLKCVRSKKEMLTCSVIIYCDSYYLIL